MVLRLLDRDERALQLLYERYGPGLLTMIQRLVRDEALAEDVLQEAWLKVWLGIGSYDAGRGRLFTWLARVCSNHAVDVLRSPRYQFHRQNRSLEMAGAGRVPAPATFTPEHIGVRELTRRLKLRQREVIDLLYFGGCTQAEAAEELCIPLATVKTRARAALLVLATLAR
ncbi:MAG: sigma-70 family RNA polymerase sigma factor [Hymenobacter sp.]